MRIFFISLSYVLFTEFYLINYKHAVACTDRAVHRPPGQVLEAVANTPSTSNGFDFERDLLPQEFRGLLEKERRVVDVDEPNMEQVRKVIESKVGSAGNRV